MSKHRSSTCLEKVCMSVGSLVVPTMPMHWYRHPHPHPLTLPHPHPSPSSSSLRASGYGQTDFWSSVSLSRTADHGGGSREDVEQILFSSRYPFSDGSPFNWPESQRTKRHWDVTLRYKRPSDACIFCFLHSQTQLSWFDNILQDRLY